MNPAVSILVPVYNVETYLRQSLDSLLAQTLENIEIICINDGSTDGSAAILREFAKKDNRIKVIKKKNTGYGDSINTALEMAQGEYIGILEPDDWVEPEAFGAMYLAAKKHHADVVKCEYYRVSGAPEKILLRTHESKDLPHNKNISAEEYPGLFQLSPAVWSALYRRDFLTSHEIAFLPTPGASYQDLSFSFKVYAAAMKVTLLDEAYVHYRVDNSSSSIHSRAKAMCVVEEYNEIETYLVERGLFDYFGREMEAARFRNYFWNYSRLRGRAGREFYKVWLAALRNAREEDLLDPNAFRSKDYKVTTLMLRFPHLARLGLSLRRLMV